MPPPPYVLDNSNDIDSSTNNLDITLPNYYEILNDEEYQKIMPPKYIISEWYENEKNLSMYKGAQYIYEETYFLPLPSLIILIFVNCLFLTFFTIWSILFIIKNETSFTFGIYLSPQTMLYLISVLIPIMVLYIFGSLFFVYIIYTPTCAIIVFQTTFAVYLYLIYLVKEHILHNRNKFFLDAFLIGLLAISLGIFLSLYCTILYLDHKILFQYLKQKKYLEKEFIRINFQDASDDDDDNNLEQFYNIV
ncbi:Hypothetical protein SRAE_1000079700 [Strongyloides ratti]|uniref:Yip1 domain-containing protein n=1 Tax=Strongyloides ratti TaxID=34506 RepID=A0A090L328_STRRB|nr:Hypothetical protein SRAE_1000079700 [Strongyloides ratti]CEF62527.1 Hypothetical protein SRAE_1000079700 [Strongyloides ratti]